MISWPGSGRRWQTCCRPREGSTTARVRRCRRTRACPTFRAQNETFRAQNETFRVQDETFRARDETFRAQNETFRAQNETFRARDETLREKLAALPARDERLPAQAAPMPCGPEALALARPTRVGEHAKTHIKTATSQGRAPPPLASAQRPVGRRWFRSKRRAVITWKGTGYCFLFQRRRTGRGVVSILL